MPLKLLISPRKFSVTMEVHCVVKEKTCKR
jgi:hypothetical protein